MPVTVFFLVMKRVILSGLPLLIPFPQQSARAQDDSLPKAVCYRARPAEVCSSFLMTEFGVRYVPARSSVWNGLKDRLLVPITVGWMNNRGFRIAFGSAPGLDPDIQYSDWRLAFGPRYRYWITGHASVEGAVDLAVAAGDVRSITVHGIWMYREVFGFEAGVILDLVDDVYTRDPVAPFIGVRLGSYPGTTAILRTAAVFGLLRLTYRRD